MKEKFKYLCLLLAFQGTALSAHQPVMDMAPRWKGGYGFQTRLETSHKSTRFSGKTKIDNPQSLNDLSSILWMEGVYSFTREHRISIKIPYVLNREKRSPTGTSKNSGMGDLIVGFLNKWYFNQPDLAGNLSFTPSLRLPTGKTSGDIRLSSGVIDYGLSLSASIESYKFYGLFDLFTWLYSEQEGNFRPGTMLGFDMDIGYHPYHQMDDNTGIFVMLGINGRHYKKDSKGNVPQGNSGGQTLEIAPTIVWYKGNVMARAQYHIPIYQNLNGTQLGLTHAHQIGIGVVF